MTKGDDGVWTVTTPPIVPASTTTRFLVDGVQVNDPGSDTFFGTGKPTSGIEIPEKGVDFYHAKDVPHGEVRSRWYKSKVTGQTRHVMVYTPPGYDADPQKQLPGPLPATRRRRGRDRLGQAGPRELHPGQPDRGQEGRADDRGHGEGLRHAGRCRAAAEPDRDGATAGRSRTW